MLLSCLPLDVCKGIDDSHLWLMETSLRSLELPCALEHFRFSLSNTGGETVSSRLQAVIGFCTFECGCSKAGVLEAKMAMLVKN